MNCRMFSIAVNIKINSKDIQTIKIMRFTNNNGHVVNARELEIHFVSLLSLFIIGFSFWIFAHIKTFVDIFQSNIRYMMTSFK